MVKHVLGFAVLYLLDFSSITAYFS